VVYGGHINDCSERRGKVSQKRELGIKRAKLLLECIKNNSYK
jgi:hypothetical protein